MKVPLSWAEVLLRGWTVPRSVGFEPRVRAARSMANLHEIPAKTLTLHAENQGWLGLRNPRKGEASPPDADRLERKNEP